MSEPTLETIDPRIRRTRQLLQQGLSKLLEHKDFDKISVLEIADAAAVNRATFYDHYTDKYSLLECLVGSRFQELLSQRRVQFDGTCPSAWRSVVLALCDYLAQMQGSALKRPLQPHMESAIVAVLRRILLDGIRTHTSAHAKSAESSEAGAIAITPEIRASTVSWAIYGGAKEWIESSPRCPASLAAEAIVVLVTPMFSAGVLRPS
jgi:AcrR family transcriptional regulator